MRALALLGFVVALGCGPKTASEAEARRDVAWLAANPTGEAVAALGRLADSDARALAALEGRADRDVNVHIAAFAAAGRRAPWGTALLKASLGDPARAELASSALPRKDPLLAGFVPDLEGAVVRLAAGQGGSLLAGIVASVGPAAHAVVERRLLDPKTRRAMCEGIATPDASSDARATLLAVPPEARDHAACVATVMELARADDAVVAWLGTKAEPGLLGAAWSTLPCPRVASIWHKALLERGPESHAAMIVPLQRSVAQCAAVLDPVLAELLAKAPRARPIILQAIDPYGPGLGDMKATCAALRAGHARGESAPLRLRASEAVQRGCAPGR